MAPAERWKGSLARTRPRIRSLPALLGNEELCWAMRLAIYQPDIPQNTGTILRLAACLGVPVDLIAPAAFDMTDRALKRAALDYLSHVAIERHADFEAFLSAVQQRGSRLLLLTTHADAVYTRFAFRPGDTLLLGRESSGVPG